MQARNKRYIAGILLLFTALVIIRHFIPKPLDWQLSFSSYQKSPYGCSITKDLLSILYPQQDIHVNSASFYLTLKNKSTDQNLIVINDRFNPDDLDLTTLLDFVKRGNTLFISSLSFPLKLCDTLHVKTNSAIIDTSLFKRTAEYLRLSYPPNRQHNKYSFTKRMPDHYFVTYDTTTTIQLGSDRAGRPDYLLTRFGTGSIYLHCQPLAFTNYHILYGNYEYACSALSALPVVNTIWDQYYKPGRVLNTSPVRYILSEPPLRSAYYVMFITLLLYMLIGARRKQRVIPVIQPLQNTSLHFIRSVGHLYYKSQDHTDIAKKKIMYFHEYLRSRYNIRYSSDASEQSRQLALKSGLDVSFTEKLLQTTGSIEKSTSVRRDDLLHVHMMIEEFYKKSK